MGRRRDSGMGRWRQLKIIIITVTAERLNESVSYLEMCNG